MVAEGGAELGEALIDLGHPILAVLGEARARAVEASIGALQQPELLGRQLQAGAVVVQKRDATKQHTVHHDRIPVPRHPERDLLVDLQDLGIGIRRHQVVEHGRDLVEQLARALQCRNRVVKVGRRRVVGDGGDLGHVVGKGLLECREEVLRLDLVKGRRLVRRLPGLEQRVGIGLGKHLGLRYL
jgi:hypothetical protein